MHSEAGAEEVVTVEPAPERKDTRPPLWTVPVLVVAVRVCGHVMAKLSSS